MPSKVVSFEEETGKERRERAMGLESHPVPSIAREGIFVTKLQITGKEDCHRT
jgi:hypothetical protein